MTDYERQGDYQPSDRSTVSTALTFLLIGLGVGALVTLLFAPKSGRQMRRLLRRKYEDAVEGVGEQADELWERGSDWVAAARDTARDKVEAAREKVEAAKGKIAPFTRSAKQQK